MPEQSKTVDAALRLLHLLGADGERSAASLARSLRLSRTATGRVLATLEAHGLARRVDNGWDVGLGVLSLAGRIEPVLRDAARPALEELAGRFGETAVLSLRDGTAVVAVDQVVATRRIVQVRYGPGSRHPLERGAHGRALLPEGVAAGHVVSVGELEPGVTGVAAAIFDGAGEVPVASIGLVAPSDRFPPGADAVAATRAAARAVTDGLATGEPGRGGAHHAPLPAGR